MEREATVSVIMGIYNCATTLERAIGAIQAQTFTDWELIMCDDGSSDNTYELASSMAQKDERLILIRNEKNLGLSAALNHCLEHANGRFIARMDGDDECDPHRFEKQVAFLEENPGYGIVSSGMLLFDETGVWGQKSVPEYPTAEMVVTGTPICHAPVMIRKECLDAVNGYTVNEKVLRVEDLDLWIKLYEKGIRAYNIQEPLYSMQNDRNAFNRRKYKYRVNSTAVRLKGCRKLNLNWKCYLKAFKPMLIGAVPASIRGLLKKKRWKA